MVLAFWLVALILISPLSSKLSGVEKNDIESWLPGSAESTAVVEAQQKVQSIDDLTAIIVYERKSGITDADRSKAAADKAEFERVGGVIGPVNGPGPSADGKALAVSLTVKFDRAHLDRLSATMKSIRDISSANGAGLEAHVAGRAAEAVDSVDAFSGVDSTLLAATFIVVIAVLLLTYRSPVLWILPIVTSTVALTVAQAVIYLLAKNTGLVVNGQSTAILTVLVFGAATDYALLIVARYREELRRHEDRHEAMALAMRRAIPAIAASAATVMAGTLCLLIAEMNSTKGLGPVAAIGIGVGLLVMTTLLPALLVIFGRWFFWPVKPRFGSQEHSRTGLWSRVGNLISGRPRVVWAVTALLLAALATAVVGLKANGLSQADTYVTQPDSVVGSRVLAEHFEAGAGEPVLIIGKPDAGDRIRTAVQGTAGLTEVSAPTVQAGFALVTAVLTDAPDSTAAADTIDRVRAAVHAVPDADAKVGGVTAVNLDIARASDDDRNHIIPLILLVILGILCLLLRALVAPLVLIATVVLSFLTALGGSALLYYHVFGFKAADTSLPLLVFVFLVALGVDYNIFLITRVREESAQHGTRKGALIGLTATGGVITSAGLVLAGTFSVLGTLPVVTLAEMGIAVALGVLIDTLIVRSVLVTALTLDIGRWMWWPSRLARFEPGPDPDPDAGPELDAAPEPEPEIEAAAEPEEEDPAAVAGPAPAIPSQKDEPATAEPAMVDES